MNDFNKFTLFIIDDNIPVVISMVNFFESKGFKVISAYNAGEVRRINSEVSFDIVIMGCRLHNVPVFDLAREMNFSKIIFITSHPETMKIAKDFDGCIGVASKPINYEFLLNLVKKYSLQKP